MAGRLVSFAALGFWLFAGSSAPAEDVLFHDRQPSPLIIDGKPVDPVCLMHLANGDSSWRDPIDLRNCSHADIVIKSGSADPRMIGFDYDYRNAPAEMRQPYFLYRYLGPYRGHTLLFIEHGGGGTGEFTEIESVDVQGHTLTPREILAGGDRCNGGVWHVSLADGHLSYSRHATPYAVMALANKAPPTDDSPKAYGGLEDSAASCVANIHYRHAAWTSVSLSDTELKNQDQSCFSEVYRAFVARRETELDHDGLDRFAAAFSKQCVRAH